MRVGAVFSTVQSLGFVGFDQAQSLGPTCKRNPASCEQSL